MKLILMFLILTLSQCISVRVYVPPHIDDNPNQVQKAKSPDSEVVFNKEPRDYFATSTFLLFGLSKHKNHYGSIEEIIKREISDNEADYYSLLPLKIEITKFELSSQDKCYTNIAEVHLEIKTHDKKGTLIQDYKYSDEIDSMVSTCTNIWTSIPVFIGWIWYGPYIGFRGNREDQLNQLGRLALMNYFEELRMISSKGVIKK